MRILITDYFWLLITLYSYSLHFNSNTSTFYTLPFQNKLLTLVWMYMIIVIIDMKKKGTKNETASDTDGSVKLFLFNDSVL